MIHEWEETWSARRVHLLPRRPFWRHGSFYGGFAFGFLVGIVVGMKDASLLALWLLGSLALARWLRTRPR